MFKNFKSNRAQSFLTLALVAVILIVVNIIANSFNSHIDLTEEGRFTVTESTTRLLKSVKDPVLVRVLLDGTFPAGFKRLQSATREMLEDLHKINGVVEYKFEDPSVNGNDEERKTRFQEMANRENSESLMRGKALELDYKGHYVTPSIHLVKAFDPKSLYQKTEIFGPNVAIYRSSDFDKTSSGISLPTLFPSGVISVLMFSPSNSAVTSTQVLFSAKS